MTPEHQKNGAPEPIAIVGVGMRYPGGITDMESFWKVLKEGRDVISEIPSNRLGEPGQIVDPARNPGKIVTGSGGFVDNIDAFDAGFFNISPREAELLDPQQRIMLEITFEALEDAGIPLRRISGTKTGVYVGQWTSDYEHRVIHATRDYDLYATTGTGRYATAGRVAYAFNLQGPSMAVDTACSSSLVTIHLACQALRNGDITCGIAGGVNIILDPFISIGYSRSKILSDYGRCRFGDASGAGYVRSEGAGVVILKRLSDAERDGDHIQGIIRGSWVNSDGQSNKYLVAPSDITQAEMLRDAYRSAAVDPSDVHYVEAHGTGTKAGDPIEFKALSEVIGAGRTAGEKCLLGSVKTNIGHTEAASGIAGFLKALLVLRHREVPESLHLKDPNPGIDWAASPFNLTQKAASLTAVKDDIIAGVNSFGITGTNAHVILQEYRQKAASPAWAEDRTWFGIPVSAQSPEALKSYAQAYEQAFTDAGSNGFRNLVSNIAHRKSDLHDRRFLLFDSPETLKAQLNVLEKGDVDPGIAEGTLSTGIRPKAVFVYPGQGSQWIGMGRKLFHSEPVFRQAILDCEKAFEPYLDWKLSKQLLEEERSDLYDTQDILQPTLFAMEIALTRLWQSWGIEPDAVVGHSMGEAAAACIAGSLSLEDAAAIICIRSGLMVTLTGTSGMGYIALSPDEVSSYLKSYDQLAIAINNSPKSVVVGGETGQLDQLLAQIEQDGVFCRKVKMDVASHSPQMDPLLGALKEKVTGIKATEGSIPFYSAVQHRPLKGSDLTPDYWVSNLRQPVQFALAVQQLIKDGYSVFVEMSPHGVLTQAVQENADHLQASIATLTSLRRNEEEEKTFLLNVGKAWCAGLTPDWSRLYGKQFTKVDLPAYPWNRERYWVDESGAGQGVMQLEKRNGQAAHPFLAHRTDLPEGEGTWAWETTVGLQQFPYLADHKLDEAVIFPAAAYIETMRAAVSEVFGPGEHQLEQLKILAALSVPEKGSRNLQVVLRHSIGNSYECSIRSRADNDSPWLVHLTARIMTGYHRDLASPKTGSGGKSLKKEEHYAMATGMGFPYGPLFQGVEKIETDGKGRWNASLRLHEQLHAQGRQYGLHPALLDAAIQVPLNISREKYDGETYIPVGVNSLWFADELADLTNVTVQVQQRESPRDTILVDLWVLDGSTVVAHMEGLQMNLLEAHGAAAKPLSELLYETTWENKDLPEASEAAASFTVLNMPEAWKHTHPGATRALDTLKSAADWDALVSESLEVHERPGFVLNIIDGDLAFDPDSFYADKGHTHALIHLAQALSRKEARAAIWLITNGSQAYENDRIHLKQAPVWGMVNVLLNEHPEWKIGRIDLSAVPTSDEWQSAHAIAFSDTDENEWVVRGKTAHVARLAPLQDEAQTAGSLAPAGDRSFAVVQPEPGVIDRLTFRETLRRVPAADEVEIEVKALGINFMNLMSVLGIYPGKENGFGTLGIECAGVVTAKGSGVNHLEVGDEVFGMCYHSMATHVLVNASLLRKKPQDFSFEEAATIPVVFLTAYYALVHLGRIAKGERILIHSATGGLGLAAIQIAQAAGAEVYATAGTEDKRDLLRSIGVKHVYHSRTLDFARQIMDDTNGEGVDLVLNSLTGEAMNRSLHLLRSFGRFLEVGKKDVYDNSQLGLEVFQRGISYSMIDLEKMVFEAPGVLGKLLEDLLPQFTSGKYRPLEFKTFGVADVKEAFTYMSRAKHVGKIVINMEGGQPQIELLKAPKTVFEPKATYLLTGGYGGLGLTFAAWMVEQGARRLVLAGRSGPKPDAQKIIDGLVASGAEIIVEQADISSRSSVNDLLGRIPAEQPLKGIIHLAGFLDDAALRNMTIEQYHRVLQPKVSGAWHLHEATKDLELNFFLLFASSSLLFGSPGQSAYVAANAFLDHLAGYRRKRGLEALSVQWGTVSEVGLAVADALQADRLAEEGIAPLKPSECTALYDRIADSTKPVVGAFRFDLERWQEAYPTAGRNPFYTRLRSAAPGKAEESSESFSDTLQGLDPEEASLAIEQRLKEMVAGVVKKPAETIHNKMAFKTLGIDSLMSIQLKNKLEKAFAIPISVTSFWTYATVREYIAYLSGALNVQSNGQPKIEAVKPKPEAAVIEEDIEDDDISDLLAAELEGL